MGRAGWIACFLAGCVEYDFHKPNDELADDTAIPTDEPPDSDDTGEPPGDDGPPDGEPLDLDDTGVWIEPCEDVEPPSTVPIDESCASDPVTGDMEVAVEWSITSFEEYSEYDQLVSVPMVGQLTDDNGDGVVDSRDTPDIVAIFDDGTIDDEIEDDRGGVLRIIAGDGSSERALVRSVAFDGDDYFPYRYSSIALGDVDVDGEPDIVVVMRGPGVPPESGAEDGPPADPPPDPDDGPIGPPPPPMDEAEPIVCHPAALTAEGELKWIYTGTFLDCGGHAPVIADLEGDGSVEVILSRAIVNGEDGTLQGVGDRGRGTYMSYMEMGTMPSISDLDGDGIQEVIAGGSVYAPDGELVCGVWDLMKDGFTATADLDGDGDGEVVLVWNHRITIFDNECHEWAEWVLPGEGTGGPPTIADFDADGEPEIGVAGALDYSVFEPEGILLWSFGTTDESSHATGSTVFDFEGDGRPEVVYADEVSLWILDGPTGYERLQDTNHTSRTLHEYPVVVDVDGDGYPELIVPNGGGHHGTENKGLYVLRGVEPEWIGGRPVWNQHAYNIVNVNDDLSIPSPADSNWPLYNNFRSGDLNPVSGDNATDALPLTVACTTECATGVVRLKLRLANQGTSILRTDMRLTVYAIHEDSWEVLELITISPPINPGETSDVISLALDAARIGPAGIVVVADDAEGVEAVRECDEDNNRVVLAEATCE